MQGTRIEQIVNHPAVSRAFAPLAQNDPRVPEWRTPGLVKLVALRKARAALKQAARNLIEEIEAGHPGYESGGIIEIPPMPSKRLLREALEAGGLPEDLETLVRAELDAYDTGARRSG